MGKYINKKAVTPYLETEVLLAVMESELDAARDMLAAASENERMFFANVLDETLALVHRSQESVGVS